MNKNKKEKIFSLVLLILFIILVIVYIKIPNEMTYTKKVTSDEYKNAIYNEVYNEIFPAQTEENKSEEIENLDEESLEDEDEILKMNTEL